MYNICLIGPNKDITAQGETAGSAQALLLTSINFNFLLKYHLKLLVAWTSGVANAPKIINTFLIRL